MKKTNVIILDDSLFIREALQQELERDINVRVVAKAASAREARDRIVELIPDILVADVNLGEMSGAEFVRIMLPQYYLPCIMISSDASNRAISSKINAVDFIAKPTSGDQRASDLFYLKILMRIKCIANNDDRNIDVQRLMDKVIVIGASTGGAQAVEQVLSKLPPVMPPIVVAQHMPKHFTKQFADRLNGNIALSVKEAKNNDLLIPGQVYIAPGGGHTTIKKQHGKHFIHYEPNAEIRPIPNINKLFQSTAEHVGKDAIGIIMTGMGKDGAHGLLQMRKSGAVTIGQDEASSVVYGMPKVAHEIGAVKYQLGIDQMADKLQRLLGL